MNQSFPKQRYSTFLRWAVVLALALVGMCAPGLAFADDGATGKASGGNVVNASPTIGAEEEIEAPSDDGASDPSTDAETPEDPGTETDAAPDPVTEFDGGPDSAAPAPGSDAAPTGEDDSAIPPAVDCKTPDTHPADGDAAPAPDKIAEPDRPTEVATPLAKDETSASTPAHKTAAQAETTTTKLEPAPHRACAYISEQPSSCGEGVDGAPAEENAPAPDAPAQPAPLDSNAPAPSPPESSWGQRDMGGGQAYDGIAVVPETEDASVHLRREPFLTSCSIYAEGPHQGPKRCRSPCAFRD